jgi:hypothetical protein
MYTINIRNKFDLYRNKIALSFFTLALVLIFCETSSAQRSLDINLPDYEKRRVQYGFFLGAHISTYRLKYSEEFTSGEMLDVHSIVPINNGGFSLGFQANIHLLQFLDFRIMPTVGFYEQSVLYNYVGIQQHKEFVEGTFVEFPLLMKYKSVRRKNTRWYLIGGINPSFEASGKKDLEDTTPRLLINRFNFALEYGFGLDAFFPLFKFSPEVRFSHGLMNMLSPTPNQYSQGIDRLTSHSVSLYLLFEGGR